MKTELPDPNFLAVGTLKGKLFPSVVADNLNWLAVYGPTVPDGMLYFNIKDAKQALRVAKQQIEALQDSDETV
jgi:hypothetical protein